MDLKTFKLVFDNPVDGYINKPIKPKEFLAKVEKLIGA